MREGLDVIILENEDLRFKISKHGFSTTLWKEGIFHENLVRESGPFVKLWKEVVCFKVKEEDKERTKYSFWKVYWLLI